MSEPRVRVFSMNLSQISQINKSICIILCLTLFRFNSLTLLSLFSEQLGKIIGKWTMVLLLQLDIQHHAMTNKTSLQGMHKWELFSFLWQQFIVQLWVATSQLPQISFVSSKEPQGTWHKTMNCRKVLVVQMVGFWYFLPPSEEIEIVSK